jgi:hypothetical protein
MYNFRILKLDGRFLNAGTGLPSWFTLQQAKNLVKSDQIIFEFCPVTGQKLWEIL